MNLSAGKEGEVMGVKQLTDAEKKELAGRLSADLERVDATEGVDTMPPEDQVAMLKRNGYDVGTVLSDGTRVGRILRIGQMTKPHSERQDKAEGFYVQIRWMRPNGSKTTGRHKASGVFTLEIIDQV
jgi:hypothetical protein